MLLLVYEKEMEVGMASELERPMRLGFIGCGKHAIRGHAIPSLALSGMFRITDAYDINLDALVRFCDMVSGARGMNSAKEVFNSPDVDAVIIATPPEFHLDLTKKAVEAGKHVFCEKPLWVGSHTSEMRAILDLATEKNLVVTSCHPRRFAPEFVELKGALPHMVFEVGYLLEFNFRFFYHEPSTAWRKEDSLLMDHMNHEIDLLHFLIGPQPLELRKRFDAFDAYEVSGCIEGDEVIGELEAGPRVLFTGTRRLNERLYRNELELVFDRGRCSLVSTLENGIVNATLALSSFDLREETILRIPSYHYENVFLDIMRNFGDAILAGGENYLTGEDLMVNNEACNELVEKGHYSYTPSWDVRMRNFMGASYGNS